MVDFGDGPEPSSPMNMMALGQSHKGKSSNVLPKAKYRTVNAVGTTRPKTAKDNTHFQMFGLRTIASDLTLGGRRLDGRNVGLE